jgi:hypothetical protein
MALRPLTPDEMLDRCDLAGIARVVSAGRESAGAPMLVKLAFLGVTKGAVRDAQGRPARFAFVRLHGGMGQSDDGAPILGGWSDWWDYPVGATVTTHLDWSDVAGAYETTWPGAVWECPPPAERWTLSGVGQSRPQTGEGAKS